jgi:hypothetical protein
MLSFEVPEAPGLEVHSDYFEFAGRDYVIFVDGFSGWTEFILTNNRRPKELIRVVRAYMTRNGVPKRIHADQGSTYEAGEFQQFCQKWGISFTDSSPKHSQGNAIAEAHVKKAKHLLTTATDEDELARGLIALMQTPVAPGMPSPAQLHFGRNLRDELRPKVEQEKREWLAHKAWKEEKARKTKSYYDRGTRQLKELEAGARVLIWHRERWQCGTVLEKLPRPRSYSVRIDSTGQRLERNRVKLRAVDEEISDERNDATQMRPSFQSQPTVPLRVLTPSPAPSRAASTPADRDEPDDDDENSESDQEETVSEEEEEDEWSDASGGTATPDPVTPPPAQYRTRQGRPVRAPDRYSPS